MNWWKREKTPIIQRPKLSAQQLSSSAAAVAAHVEPKPKPGLIEVEEIDTTDMTKTGVFRAWQKLSGRTKEDR